jgi:hypothetical protein
MYLCRQLVVMRHRLGLVRCHRLLFIVFVAMVAVKPKQMIKLVKKDVVRYKKHTQDLFVAAACHSSSYVVVTRRVDMVK